MHSLNTAEMSCYETIRIDLHNLKELPPLAESSKKILDAINDPDISLEFLCEILEDNPSITARLLIVANSAYFGYRGTVASIRQAVIQVLGIKLVKAMTLGIVVADALDTRECPKFSCQRYWSTAVTVATLTKQLCAIASNLQTTDPTLAYTAGLLHNIGLLALVHKFPVLMSKVLDESTQTDLPIAEILQRDYRLDQHQSGGWLVGRWQFPEPIRVSIREQDNPQYTGQFNALVTLIRATVRISDDLYRGNESSSALVDAATDLGISQSKALQMYREFHSQLEDTKSLAKLLGENKP